MKIAIPTVNGELCAHFGHCQQFAVLEVDAETKSITASEMLTPPQHEPGVLPAWLNEMGCNMIIAGGMGGRAIQLFQNNNIEVIIGASAAKPEDIVMSHLNGELQSGQNLCDH